MAYVKVNWAAGVTPLSEANMDHLETQYDEVMNLFDAQSILAAVVDNTPVVLPIAASRIIGRKAAGNIAALTGAEVLTIVGWTAAKLLLGAGAGVAPTKIDVPSATKEFFVNALTVDDGIFRTPGALISGAGNDGYATFLIPQDFTTLTSVEAILMPNETGASMHYAIVTRWGSYAGGEDYNVHTETVAAQDMGATVTDQNLNLDISGFLDVVAMAAGDLVMVEMQYDATAINSNFYFRGVRLKYT